MDVNAIFEKKRTHKCIIIRKFGNDGQLVENNYRTHNLFINHSLYI